MPEEKKPTEPKAKKVADPIAASIDTATQQMIKRAQELGVETAFDRAVTMKPCNIGTQGICCKNCGMGPCRLPLPKSGIEGEDTRKGICGATPNTIAARNFISMIAGGAAAHSDHGRAVAEVFMSAARKETDAYRIKDTRKLLEVAPYLGVETTVEVDGQTLDRDIDEIALEVAENTAKRRKLGKGQQRSIYTRQEATHNKVGGVGKKKVVFVFFHVFALDKLMGNIRGEGAARPLRLLGAEDIEDKP